jgi:hypothetical protein
LSPAEAPSRDVDGAVLAAVRDRARALEAAERLFEKQVAGVTLEPDEGELLRYLFPSEFDRARELSRVARLRKFQRQAGTEAERKAARVARDEAAQKLAGEGSRIREQVEALQRELVALERSATETAAVVERQSTAVAALHDPAFLPEPHRSRYEAGRQAWERDWGIPARSARLRSDALQAIAKLNPDDRDELQKIHEHCSGSSDPATRAITAVRVTEPSPYVRVSRPGNELLRIAVNPAAWQHHVQDLQVEAEQAAAEAERLEREGAGAREELDNMLVGLILQ